MLRKAKEGESSFLVKQASQTEPWKKGEAEELLGGILHQYFSGELPEEHTVSVWEETAEGSVITGWSYYAPNMYAEGVWDVWWFGVGIEFHKKGHGTSLIKAIEQEIRGKGGRVIVIETSSTQALLKARRFYAKMGYHNCGSIPHFYGENDDKVIFSKSL